MTGQELHNILKSIEINGKKIVFKELAEKLEISEQNLNKKFQVQDVGTGLVESICKVLNIPIGVFLSADVSSFISEPGTDYKRKKTDAELLAEHAKLLLDIQKKLSELNKKVEKNTEKD